MNRNYKMYIDDILDSIRKINDYTEGLSFDSFKTNEMVIDAVVRNLEIIGEASKNIPDEVKQQHSNIPWKKMIGLRNMTAHEYFGIDLSIIWEIITKNLIETKKDILDLLDNLKE